MADAVNMANNATVKMLDDGLQIGMPAKLQDLNPTTKQIVRRARILLEAGGVAADEFIADGESYDVPSATVGQPMCAMGALAAAIGVDPWNDEDRLHGIVNDMLPFLPEGADAFDSSWLANWSNDLAGGGNGHVVIDAFKSVELHLD